MSKQDDLLRDIDGLGGLEASERLPAIQGILRGLVRLGGSSGGGGGGAASGDTSGTNEEIKERVTKILDAKSDEISEWEKGFLVDMEKKRTYSDKMKAVVNKCYKKVFK